MKQGGRVRGRLRVPVILSVAPLATVGFPGAALILFATWYKVELDVKINDGSATSIT